MLYHHIYVHFKIICVSIFQLYILEALKSSDNILLVFLSPVTTTWEVRDLGLNVSLRMIKWMK